MRLKTFIGPIVSGTLAMLSSMAGAQTVANGGFETPPPPAGGFTLYNPGNAIGAFTVFGPSGSNVAVISTTFSDFAGTNNAQSGGAFLDLTGSNDSGVMQGVVQSVATVAGQAYTLSFFLGHQRFDGNPTIIGVSTTGQFGTYSSFTNGDTSGTEQASIVYKPFSLTFTATASSTSIAFRLDQPAFIRSAALDDIAISPLAVAVPGPVAGAGIPAILGLAVLAIARRRRTGEARV